MARKAPDPPSRERREILTSVGRAFGVLALGAGALGSAACAPLIDPEAVSEHPLADVPEGRSNVLHAGRRVELHRSGDVVRARLLICTHEFCDLFWREPDNAYRCTCHDARFAPDGSPRSGPVSKPMFELPARIAGERVIVGPAGELTLTG